MVVFLSTVSVGFKCRWPVMSYKAHISFKLGNISKRGRQQPFKKNPINYAFKMYGFRVLFLTANYCILFQIDYFHLVEFSKLVLSKVVNGLKQGLGP